MKSTLAMIGQHAVTLACLMLLTAAQTLPVSARESLHDHILVYIPGFEASALRDDAGLSEGGAERLVWGQGMDLAHYADLALPNKLSPAPLPMLNGRDLSAGFEKAMTSKAQALPSFRPYKLGADFFVFHYDWRQGIGEGTAPALTDALVNYARLYALASGRKIENTQFVLVAHGSGGLVARTFLSQKPRVAEHIKRLYLVATPNLGTTHALMALIAGRPTSAKTADHVGLILNIPGKGVSAKQAQRVAVTLPGLYQLLPMRDPRWVRINRAGASSGVSLDDMLTIGTWRPHWPMSTLLLATDDLTARLDGEAKAPDLTPASGNSLLMLQRILADTRDWRLQLGTVAYTDKLLTRAGQTGRLRIIYGKGVKTPNGLVAENAEGGLKARFTYDVFADGDGIVTATSAVEDLKAPKRVIALEGVRHSDIPNSSLFLNRLRAELAELSAPRELRATARKAAKPSRAIPWVWSRKNTATVP